MKFKILYEKNHKGTGYITYPANRLLRIIYALSMNSYEVGSAIDIFESKKEALEHIKKYNNKGYEPITKWV